MSIFRSYQQALPVCCPYDTGTGMHTDCNIRKYSAIIQHPRTPSEDNAVHPGEHCAPA